MSEYKPFNPLDKRHLAESIADAIQTAPLHSLPPEPFIGAGVYMIYYCGNSGLYSAISSKKFNRPIYVGKAVPAGARKGMGGIETADPGRALFNRLSDHHNSISDAENLNIEDFRCRYLCVDDIWIPMGETLLIQKFAPVWNVVVEGFGNHDPGKGRRSGKKSAWDILHPGRKWATNLPTGDKTRQQIEEDIRRFLS